MPEGTYISDGIYSYTYAERHALEKIAQGDARDAMMWAGHMDRNSDAFREVVEQAFAIDPSGTLDRSYMFGNQAWAEPLLREIVALTDVPGGSYSFNMPAARAVMREYHNFKDAPYAEALLSDLARTHPDHFLMGLPQRDVTRQATDFEPLTHHIDAAVSNLRDDMSANAWVLAERASLYEDRPYAPEVLAAVINEFQTSGASYHSYAPLNGINHDPVQSAIDTMIYEQAGDITEYADLTGSTTNVDAFTLMRRDEEGILRAALEQNPRGVADYLQYAYKPNRVDASERWENALYEDAISRVEEPNYILGRSWNYADQPFAEAVIRNAAITDPDTALRYNHYTDAAYADEVIDTAVETLANGEDRHRLVVLSDAFAHRPYAEELLTELAGEFNARFFIERAHNFDDQPYHAEVLYALARQNPQGVLDYVEGSSRSKRDALPSDIEEYAQAQLEQRSNEIEMLGPLPESDRALLGDIINNATDLTPEEADQTPTHANLNVGQSTGQATGRTDL